MKKISILGIACTDVIVTGYSGSPNPGVLNSVDSISLHTGGCAINTAIDLAKMGIFTDAIVPVGSDEFGEFIKNQLDSEGLSTNHVIQKEHCKTSSSIVLIHPSGERSFLHDVGANGKLTIHDIDLDVILKTDILFIAGALVMKSFDGLPMSHILKYAKEHGVFTVLDTVWDPSGAWMKTLEPCLPYIDLFAPSLDEAKMLSGYDDVEDIVSYFKEKKANDIIIKLGKEGAYADIHGEKIYVSSIEIKNPKDTTGAGDSFMAGILAGLANEWPYKKMLQFGNVVGSLCVQNVGASSGILSLEDILKIWKEKYNEN